MVGEVKHCKSLENLLLFLSSGLPSLVFLDKAGQHLVSLHLKLVHHLIALHADKPVNLFVCVWVMNCNWRELSTEPDLNQNLKECLPQEIILK